MIGSQKWWKLRKGKNVTVETEKKEECNGGNSKKEKQNGGKSKKEKQNGGISKKVEQNGGNSKEMMGAKRKKVVIK